MTRRNVVASWVIATLLSLSGNAAAQTASITGVIRDAATGVPVASVVVQATSGDRPGVLSSSRADGTYTIAGLNAGSWVVTASKLGYADIRSESVTVASGETARLDLAITIAALELNPIVVTASRGTSGEKMLDAPASVSVVRSEQIDAKPVALVTDYLKTLPGVSIVTAGIGHANVVSRGFNSAFSPAMLGLQDYRFSGLPSLRANLPLLYTGAIEDIERIEVLNGPAAALYGPNAANGVLHIITKSPFNSQGTSLTVDGGSRSILRLGGRSSQVFGDAANWGAKISGEYFTGNDWPDPDPNLPAVFPATAPPERAGRPLQRGSLVRRYTGEARLDYRSPDRAFENILTTGYTHILNSNEATSAFGATQGRDWTYTSIQDRVRYKRFFAQVFYNGSNSGSTNPTDPNGSFYLTTGIPIVDNSSVMVFQAQQGFDLLTARLVAGIDYIDTRPRSEGSVYGRYETTSSFGDTRITEQGAYLHGTIPLHDVIDLTAAARLDQTNRLSGTQFSPRVGLTFKPDPLHNIRGTYSRAFNSPIGYQYLLDQVANPVQAPGFALRVVGNPSRRGWQFDRSCDASINAGLCMRSPWVAGGGSATVPSSAARAFPGFIAALPAIVNALPTLTAVQKGQLNGLLTQLNPILSTLAPTATQVGTVLYLNEPVAVSAVKDIDPLQASFNDTWEIGYKGIIREQLRVAVDLWYQIRGDVGLPLALANPLVFYDPAQLGAYLVSSITQGLVAQGMSPQDAQATAIASAGALVPLMAAFPQGTLAFTSALNNDQSIILTYLNGSGKVHVRGVDVALDFQPRPEWMLSATYSFQNRVVFTQIGGVGNPLMSNTPKHRATATARYDDDDSGIGVETTLRYADAFPVNSGYYNSLVPNVYNPAFTPLSPVPAQMHLDVGLSYRLRSPRVTLGINASNLLDNRVPTFSGTPAIGRLLLGRVRYTF